MGPVWPQWTDTGAALRFDTRADGGPEVFSRTESPLGIATDLAADDRIDGVQRCRIRDLIVSGQPALASVFDPVLACQAD